MAPTDKEKLNTLWRTFMETPAGADPEDDPPLVNELRAMVVSRRFFRRLVRLVSWASAGISFPIYWLLQNREWLVTELVNWLKRGP